jgi:hypothetical protein
MIDTSLDFALAFLRDHPAWYIFPITRLEKDPPLIKDNLNLASNDPKQIKEWHARWRGCNWGLALRKSKVIVVDVDRKVGKVGQETLDNLTLEYGDLPTTLTVMSPSGGLHIYFEGEHRFGLGKYGFGKDVDSPNYVLIPGCWLCSNSEQGYEVITDAPVAQAPEWFGVFLKEKAEREAAPDEAAVDLDRDPNVARMIRYLMEGAPKCVQGQNGDKTMFDIYCVLKDNGVSLQRATEIVQLYYNTPEHCEPVWLFGSGPDADRHDVKARNAYDYARENQAGTATAEYAFGDPTDAYDPAELKAYTKLWDKRLRDQTKVKDAKRVKNRTETLFTEEARGIDQLTGEPFENQGVIDPLTGEPWQGMGADDDEPPKPTKPTTPIPTKDTVDGPADDPPPGDDAGKGEEEPEPEMPKGDGGSGTPKSKQNLEWIQANWVWIVSAERFMRLSDGAMWNVKQFDSYYNNLTDKSSMSNSLFKSDAIRKVERYVYRPGRPVMIDRGRLVNLWRPGKITPKEGDTTMWNEHLNYLFQNEDDRDLVLNWMAWVMQNISKKPNHGLLLVGKNTGTGKSFIARVLEQLIGPDNTQRPKNSSLKGDFNAWANSCKLCIIEELMQIGRREVANELRDTITESTIEVNIKNITAQKIENYMAMLAITNHRDAMPMEETERRWLVIETFADKRDGAYYDKLWPILDNPDALAAIAFELKQRDLKGYNAQLSPTETTARTQMIEMSRSDLEHWLYDNKDNPPLCYTLTTLSDVMSAIPTTMMKTGRARSTVTTFIRDKLRGEAIRAIRLSNGTRVRVWALNGKGAILGNLDETQLANRYESERKQTSGSRTPEEQAAEDFGD